jgi:hypothetical protein
MPRNSFKLPILILLTLLSQALLDSTDQCWTPITVRQGTKTDKCPEGYENIKGVCFLKCKPGYTEFAGACWSNCPNNMQSIVAFCQKPQFIARQLSPILDSSPTGGCPDGYSSYMTFYCTINCPAPLKEAAMGLTCAKDSHLRLPAQPICEKGLDQFAGKCFKPCESGFKGFGMLCVKDCPKYYIQCGVACVKDVKSCTDAMRGVLSGGLSMLEGFVSSEDFKGDFTKLVKTVSNITTVCP